MRTGILTGPPAGRVPQRGLSSAQVLTTATGDWTDATVIILVIVVNTTAGVIQEVKADHAISALTHLTAPEARGDPRRRAADRAPAIAERPEISGQRTGGSG